MGRYSVPERRLSLSLGSHSSPGYFGVHSGSPVDVASPVSVLLVSPCPFWTKPLAYVGLLTLTTMQREFVFLSMLNCARRSLRLGSE